MRLASSLVLALVPLGSGCAIMEAPFEPVFTPALWELGEQVEPPDEPAPAPTPAPRPVELCRAARTGDGVWHLEARMSDGSLRHHVWDVAHPALRAHAEEEMARWTSPAWYEGQAMVAPSAEPWPEDALQLPVLPGRGAELPRGAPRTEDEERSRELFAPLAGPCGAPEPPGTVVRLAGDGLQVELATPQGWAPLACYRPPPAVRPAAPRWRPRGARLAEGAIKVGLTPAMVGLDAGYLALLGAAKLTTGVFLVPGALILLGFWWGHC